MPSRLNNRNYCILAKMTHRVVCADDVTQHASTEQLAARVRGGAATRAISHFPQRS